LGRIWLEDFKSVITALLALYAHGVPLIPLDADQFVVIKDWRRPAVAVKVKGSAVSK
jgi:hypothetical protein